MRASSAKSKPRTGAANARRNAPATQQTADRLHSLAIHLLRWLRREDEATGLSGTRLSALSVVVVAGTLSLGQLAQAEQVRAPSMSKVISALVRAGLVRRQVDARDRRAIRLEATPAGRALLMRGRARRVNRLARALADLSAGERAGVSRAVDSLRRMLERERGA